MPATIRGRLALISTPTPFRKRHARLVLIDRGRFFAFSNLQGMRSVRAKNRGPVTIFKVLKSAEKFGSFVFDRAPPFCVLDSNIDFCLIVFFLFYRCTCMFVSATYTMHLMHLNLTA